MTEEAARGTPIQKKQAGVRPSAGRSLEDPAPQKRLRSLDARVTMHARLRYLARWCTG